MTLPTVDTADTKLDAPITTAHAYTRATPEYDEYSLNIETLRIHEYEYVDPSVFIFMNTHNPLYSFSFGIYS